MREDMKGRCCAVVPCYNEQKRIGQTVRGIREFCRDVVVVDDGSSDATAVEAERAGATVVRQPINQGKGAALAKGFGDLDQTVTARVLEQIAGVRARRVSSA